MKKYIILLSAGLWLCLMSSCTGQAAKGNNDSGKKDTDTGTAAGPAIKNEKFDRKFNDIARFLAAMPAEQGSQFAHFDTVPAYKKFVQEFNSNWSKMEQSRMVLLRKWRDEEISPKIDPSLPCFYPFSGPDFLHAYEFYPKAKKYMMFAQESVGSLPDFDKINDTRKMAYLFALQKSMADIFNRSYYITQYMGRDLPVIDGTISTFLVYLARTGHTIENMELIGIDSLGNSFVRNKTLPRVNGVRFYFHTKDNVQKTLEYFSTDISDITEKTGFSGLTKNKGVVTYIKKYGKSNTFIKAGSYLLHYETFSIIRNTTIEISQSILEDDPGIPYKYLKDKFNIYPYGVYTYPIANFARNLYQPHDLAKVYADSAKVKPLPISLGYHVKDGKQNYMLFVRK